MAFVFQRIGPRRVEPGAGAAIVGPVQLPVRRVAALLGLLALPVCQALAAGASLPNTSSPRLWATFGTCARRHHALPFAGVRGSMPGTGDRRESMYMSFRLEYLGADGQRTPPGRGGLCPAAVGSGGWSARQAGQDFTVALGTRRSYVLRGVVSYQWRLHGRTSASTLRSSTAGHGATPGSQPSGCQPLAPPLAAAKRARIVRDHPGDAERRQAGDLGAVVDRPRIELPARTPNRLHETRHGAPVGNQRRSPRHGPRGGALRQEGTW